MKMHDTIEIAEHIRNLLIVGHFEKERKRGEYLFVAFLFDGFYEEPPTINNENA